MPRRIPSGPQARAAMERLLTVEEAAAAIHETVKPTTIRAAIREGRLTARRIGKRYYRERPHEGRKGG